MADQDDITLDEILAMPDPAAPPAPKAEGEGDQPRGEHGHFAPKAPDAPAAEPPPAPEEAPAATPPATGMVPQQALHAARESERTAKEELAEMRRRYQQQQGQIDLLNRRTTNAPAPKPVEATPDIWIDPGKFVTAQMTPMQEAIAEQQKAAVDHKLSISRLLAHDKFGDAAVNEAEAALKSAVEADPALSEEVKRIVRSDHPYREVVAWHKAHQSRQRVGDDPDAFVDSELEKRLADPAQAAKILERITQGAASSVGRAAPAIQLPPSLSKLPGGANTPTGGDMSDAAVFAHATAGMGRR